MAIRLNNSGTLIVLPPKVGGTWLRRALTAGSVSWVEVGPPQLRGQGDLADHSADSSFFATFVRAPLEWYRSYWAYRMERGWRRHYALDKTCGSEDFATFIREVIINYPGFLSALFSRYAGPETNPVDFIGRQERLADDLVVLLRNRGEVHDEEALLATPRANQTTLRPENPTWLMDAVHIAEQEMESRFGYRWYDTLSLSNAQTRYPEDRDDLRRLVLWTERTHWKADDPKRVAGDTTVDDVRQARCLSNFALYAQYIKADVSYAEECFLAALKKAPNHPRTLANFAVYLADVAGDELRAEGYFRRALESRPNHIHSLLLFEQFLVTRGRAQEASEIRSRRISLATVEESIRGEAGELFGGGHVSH